MHFFHCSASNTAWTKHSKPVTPFKNDNGIKIVVKPNPSDTWAAFDYELPNGMTEAVITLTDVQGKTIQSITLHANKGQWVWDIRNARSGVYFYRLQAGNLQANGKCVVK
jgi:hypothetical protein